jgi:hypothetical protein
MSTRLLLWGAALVAALTGTLVAQQAPSASQQSPNEWYRVFCVKVNPGKAADFVNFVNGDLRKFSQAQVDSGSISHWGALQAVNPAGSEAECDYLFGYFSPGIPPAPMTDKELAAVLQKAGLNMTARQFRERLDDLGTLVSTSINREAARVGGAKEGDYIVINEMSVPNTNDWIAAERKLWQPIFQDGLKDGAVDGWSVNVQVMPHGAKDRHLTYTVDIYPNWQAVFTFVGPGFSDRWKKVHPDVSLAEGMAQYGKLRTAEYSTLYQVVAAGRASK